MRSERVGEGRRDARDDGVVGKQAQGGAVYLPESQLAEFQSLAAPVRATTAPVLDSD